MTQSSGRSSGGPVAAGSLEGALSHPHPPRAYPPPPLQPHSGFTPPPTGPRNGLGIASLVIGIVALMTSVSVLGGVILGIVAAAIGLAARNRVKRGEANNGGVTMAGIVLGIVATVVSLIVVGAFVVIGIATEAFNSSYQHCIGEHPGAAQSCDEYRWLR
jgi:hypothetical protein